MRTLLLSLGLAALCSELHFGHAGHAAHEAHGHDTVVSGHAEGGHAHAHLGPAPAGAPIPGALIPGAVIQGATTGSGAWIFKHRAIEFPPAMARELVHAHGGFAQDAQADGGDGASYFSLRNVGLLRLRPDLSGIDVLGGDEAFQGVNLHNTCLFREQGRAYLALPSDEAQRAFLTTLEGGLLRTFPNPYSLGPSPSDSAFRVCDLEYADGLLFAANGYADNVCFAARPLVGSAADGRVGTWESLRFGGTGSDHGRFGTAHGITRFPGTNTLTVADRANARLESFSTAGRYIGGITLPAGSMPCDVDYHGDLALVGCLKGPGGETPAPIYLLEKGNLVAELNIGRDLGLEGFTHIHNASFHTLTAEDGSERLFVLAYAWNPGNFAILEHVPG